MVADGALLILAAGALGHDPGAVDVVIVQNADVDLPERYPVA